MEPMLEEAVQSANLFVHKDMSDVFLPLHLISLAFVLWNVLRADHAGFLWVRGIKKILDESMVRKYHRGTWIGLCCMIFTGLFLFYPMREFLLERPQFYIKMFFVVILILNGFAIGKLSNIATQKSFSSLSTKEKLPLVISGLLSTIAWLMVIASAFYLIPD